MSDAVMPAVDGITPELLPDKDKVYYNDYSTLVQQQGPRWNLPAAAA